MKTYLIIGGTGFIGRHLQGHLAGRGGRAVVAGRGLVPLQNELDGTAGAYVPCDVRDAAAVERVVAGINPDVIVHLVSIPPAAARADPRSAFDVNVLGTLNVLEAARKSNRPPAVVYASTSKVYGATRLPIVRDETRFRSRGKSSVDETFPLTFQGPYSVGKGAADWYVRDYARTYGLQAVVLRIGTTYGPHGGGWVERFMAAAACGDSITVNGDGFQVRDLLYVTDLCDVFVRAAERVAEVSGLAFNVGGGLVNSVSVWPEFSKLLHDLGVPSVPVVYDQGASSDAPYYVSNTAMAKCLLGWEPRVRLPEGLRLTWEWVKATLTDSFGGVWWKR